MAQVYYGDADDFKTICFGMPDPRIKSFLMNRWNDTKNFFTNNDFINNSERIIEKYYYGGGMERARAVLKNTGRLLNDPNAIYPLKTLEEFQTAPPGMRRWIMANPTVRELNQKQLIQGYEGKYVDNDPDTIGNDNYDYRLVMDGIVNINKDSSYTNFFDELKYGDRRLTLDEKIDILNTWDKLEDILKNTNEDPTNIYGGTR